MKLTFLGTGTSQGVPIIGCKCEVCTSDDLRDNRLRTSALLQTDRGKHLLFDIGPDFRQQLLRRNVSHIDAVLVTHAHRDHVAGIDDIRPINYIQHGPLDFYLNAPAAKELRRAYHYIFDPHLFPGLPEVELHEVDEAFEAAGEAVLPIHAMHKDLPVLGFRVGPMAYITDASHIAEKELEKLQGLKVLVINALRREKHWSHYSLPEALEVIAGVRPGHAYITHISHDMGRHSDVDASLPEGVSLAYDNLEIEI